MKEVVARPGELVIAQQDGIITSYALGSSLGICLYDKEKRVGGYVNSILPENPGTQQNAKYVGDAVMMLYHAMQRYAVHDHQLYAKIIGGAKLFLLPDEDRSKEVGRANIQAAYAALTRLHIPIEGEDVGDMYGRTLHFHIETGIVYIETGNRYVYHI